MTQATAIVHVVDDDESLRTALMRLLRASGYEVRTYASAGDFLLNKPESAPGCVVLDVRMPGPSGFELQEAIAKLDESLPIIFLTGHGDIPMSVRAIKAGAVDFLTKPVRKETLLQAVRTALAGSAERCATRELLHSLR
ncbi:MAG: response regulator transcription factor, partial [Chthoniobacterales bacterium]